MTFNKEGSAVSARLVEMSVLRLNMALNLSEEFITAMGFVQVSELPSIGR
jgi:hypothetical protein